MPIQTRALVALGLGYVTYAFGEALFPSSVTAAAVGVVLGACVFALTKRYPHED